MRLFLSYVALFTFSCAVRSPSASASDSPEGPPQLAADRQPNEGSPQQARRYESGVLAYSWTLPSDWEWADVRPEQLGVSDVAHDVVVARPRGRDAVLAAVIVADYPAMIPGRRAEEQEDYLESLQEMVHGTAKQWLLSPQKDGPYEFRDRQGWRMEGTAPRVRQHFSLEAFGDGRRSFRLWCETRRTDQLVQCDAAFEGIAIGQQANETEGDQTFEADFVVNAPDVPFRYSPPGEGWRGRGPVLSMKGEHRTWQWIHRERPQVEVSFGPIAQRSSTLDSVALANLLAAGYRTKCEGVSVQASKLGGKPAARILLDGCHLPVQDMIVVNTPEAMFTMLIVPKGNREEDFIRAAAARMEFR